MGLKAELAKLTREISTYTSLRDEAEADQTDGRSHLVTVYDNYIRHLENKRAALADTVGRRKS